ncbi:DEKNAAC102002 [Brettanomyces naardenensis]|uniref:Protein HRI1 n=1 Tax=Brettanomyces naardenensis TaxID=13370 RepID=A0A448YJG6_BRENA|nr:DEKNAAC102002 [Brettanomyces naardenensis]
MSLSTRLSIRWPESEPEQSGEKTDTLVLTTPGGKYVDVRSYKASVLSENPGLDVFPFEWVFAGEEQVLSRSPLRIDFTHNFFDSAYILQLQKYLKKESDLKPDRQDIPVDCGQFVTLDSGVREETGEMINNCTGAVEPYIEHWLSLDPLKSTPVDLIQFDDSTTMKVRTVLFDIVKDLDIFEGRFVRVGNWAEGMIWDKANLDRPISVIRRFFDGSNWTNTVEFGDSIDKFSGLERSDLKEGEVVEVRGVNWTCKECV